MSDSLNRDERFKTPAGELWMPVHDSRDYMVAEIISNGRLVTIRDADLTVAEARQLRDWLNERIP